VLNIILLIEEEQKLIKNSWNRLESDPLFHEMDPVRIQIKIKWINNTAFEADSEKEAYKLADTLLLEHTD